MLFAEQVNRFEVAVQALAPKRMVLGYAKLAWFRMLKSSARNWSVYRSVIWNRLKNEVSTSTRPGPRSDPRETLPKVPATGIRNALGLNHRSGLPKTMGPVTFGFQSGTSVILGSPVPEILEPTRGVSGKPP